MSLSRFEEELRLAASGDTPSDAQRAANRARVMEAAGLAAALAAATGAGATAGTVETAGPGLESAGAGTAATKGASLGAVKLVVVALAIALAGAVAILGGLRGGDRDGATGSRPAPSASASTPALTPATASSSPPPEDHGPSGPQVVTAPPVVASPQPDASEASALPSATSSALLSAKPATLRAAAPSATASARPEIDPLSVETRLLEETRTCIAAHDLAGASSRLATYDVRFPRGVLADEAALLQIDVARARGDKVEARRLAERLLATHPMGAYARRARAILAELKD